MLLFPENNVRAIPHTAIDEYGSTAVPDRLTSVAHLEIVVDQTSIAHYSALSSRF